MDPATLEATLTFSTTGRLLHLTSRYTTSRARNTSYPAALLHRLRIPILQARRSQHPCLEDHHLCASRLSNSDMATRRLPGSDELGSMLATSATTTYPHLLPNSQLQDHPRTGHVFLSTSSSHPWHETAPSHRRAVSQTLPCTWSTSPFSLNPHTNHILFPAQ